MSKYEADVKITMPNGPQVQGTIITIDGVEQKGVTSVIVELNVADIGRLYLRQFAEIEVNGKMEVDQSYLCPDCKRALDENKLPILGAADVTSMSQRWKRRIPVAPTILDRAVELLQRQPEGTEDITKWFEDRNRLLEEIEFKT